jgi:hypothetical protein
MSTSGKLTMKPIEPWNVKREREMAEARKIKQEKNRLDIELFQKREDEAHRQKKLDEQHAAIDATIEAERTALDEVSPQ